MFVNFHKIITLGFLVCCLPFVSFAQEEEVEERTLENHETYAKLNTGERKAVAHPHLREADVIYSRRISRLIDSREKKNQIINWPANRLGDIIYKAITKGIDGEAPLTAYRTDSLVTEMTTEEVLKQGSTEQTSRVYPDPDDPDFYYDTVILNEFNPVDIIKFRIAEDVIFDKQRGMFVTRIVAIAPLYRLEVEGQDLGEEPIAWVKYDDLRHVLVNQEMFNRHNDAMRLSFLDFFEARLFASYIVKEPNSFDYDIMDFEEYENDPYGALLESERIKEEIFNFEQDLWEY